MFKCWSVKDLSSFFCLLLTFVSVDYDKLLFHDDFKHSHRQICCERLMELAGRLCNVVLMHHVLLPEN
jgi:hypothetical protein